jgi:D-serine deaminase-like pyridoxal phosphate-dependent protein
MATSRDRGAGAFEPDPGYGLVCDEGGAPLNGWSVTQTNQEHGIVEHRAGAGSGVDVVTRFPVGTRLRVLPNHACATAAQHARYAVVEGDAVRHLWPRFNGW